MKKIIICACLLATLVGFAQTKFYNAKLYNFKRVGASAPAGDPYTPTNLAGYPAIAYFAGAYSDGTWTDHWTNHWDWVAPSAGWNPGTSTLDSKPTVVFDGTDYLRNSTWSNGIINETHMVARFNANNDAVHRILESWDANCTLYRTTAGAWRWKSQNAGSVPTNRWGIYTFVSSASDAGYILTNGINHQYFAGALGSASGGMALGGRWTDGAEAANMEIAEVVSYDTNLSGVARDELYQYWRTKYPSLNLPAKTYLIYEDFEGTGAPAGWTITSNGGTANPDSTSPALQGTQSLYMIDDAYALANALTPPYFAGGPKQYGYVQLSVSELPITMVGVVSFRSQNNARGGVQLMADGKLRINGNLGGDVTTASGITANTKWHIWWSYDQTTSPATVTVAASTDGIRPTEGGYFASGQSSFSSEFDNLLLEPAYLNVGTSFDMLIVDDIPIGNMPTTLTNGIVSYWAMNETSGSRADAVGTNTLADHATPVGYNTGKIGNAASLGGNNFLAAADSPELSLGGTKSFTIAGWFSGGSTVGRVISKGVSSDWETEFSLETDSGKTTLTTGWTSSYGQVDTTGIHLYSGGFKFVVVWRDHAAGKNYVQINNGTIFEITAADSVDTAGLLRIGASIGGSNYWTGLADEVGYWNRALTQGERMDLYNAGSGRAYPFQ